MVSRSSRGSTVSVSAKAVPAVIYRAMFAGYYQQ
jgi:hypothetical protein